jgi:hypothetical protein
MASTPSGKSVNLRVRPVQSVDLCYPVNGVICNQSPVLLGSQVEGLDVEVLYGMLGETAAGDDSRLLWDTERIFSYLLNVTAQAVGPFGNTLLSRLRNASEAADLDRALMMRQNAYLTSYSPRVLSEVRSVYHDNPRDQSAVRYRLLQSVEYDISHIHGGLANAYNSDPAWRGVKHYAFSDQNNDATQLSGSAGSDKSTVTGDSTTKSYGYEFRYPSAENDLRYHQARAAVRQDFLNAWRMSEMCRYEHTTFPNEIGAIDRSIRKLQAAYIDTFLFAPFGGIVTGVFHGQGDFVRAGDPVIRVETDEPVYLVGTVKYRGMLRIGSELEVSTTLFEAAGAAKTTVSGKVVAVRGHDSVSEQWDLLILCSNRTAAGDPILPLNYNFDFESTTVDVTAY